MPRSSHGNGRIAWLDILKLLGIMSVYIGHQGPGVGRLYPFVWNFEIPLLFFCSGVIHKDREAILPYIKRKALCLMVPYYFFLLLCLGKTLLLETVTRKDILWFFIYGILGCKEFPFVDFLWFFPALFAMSIIARWLHILIPDTRIRFPVCLVLSYLAGIYLAEFKHVPLSLNLSLVYLMYYEAGFALHSIYRGKLRLAFRAGGWLFIVYAAVVYRLGSRLIPPSPNPVLSFFTGTCGTFFLILAFIYMAKALQGCSFFARLGKHTLYYYGNELLIKTIFSYLCIMLGLSYEVHGEMIAIINSALLVFLVYKVMIPLEQPILNKMVTAADKILSRLPFWRESNERHEEEEWIDQGVLH